MIRLCSTHCCGMREINNLSHESHPEMALAKLTPYMLSERWTFIVFSGVVKRLRPDHASGRLDNYGQAFATFIKKHHLGAVVSSPARTNRETGNRIKVWIWAPNYTAISRWFNLFQQQIEED